MCGISGHLFPSGTDRHAGTVLAMLQAISYRGPDHLGMMSCDHGSMGNVRLAIQGIDPDGNQPIWNEDHTVCVVFNGEIYNFPELRRSLVEKGHIFCSQTDTEVLVHLYEDYGTGFVNQLNGMFAFALFDKRQQKLILARDRTGQKPLFLRTSPGPIAFCSELGPLIRQFGTEGADPAAIQEFLALGYVLEPRTICRDYRALTPGTVEIFTADGSHTTETFWQLPIAALPVQSLDEWLEMAEPMFRRAIRRHAISDVPVTLFLSGGVDSSLLMMLASQETGIRETYCGSFVDAADHDEYRYAAELSRACGLNCRRIELSEQVLVDTLPDLLAGMSQPLGDYSALAVYPLAAEVARNYRVVLGGDGGDELFGGYPTYRLPHLQKKYWFVHRRMISIAHRILANTSDRKSYMNLAFQLQQVAQAWGQSASDAHFQVKNFLPDSATEVLHSIALPPLNSAAARFRDTFSRQNSQDVSVALANVDIETFMQSGTIPKVERMTMLHSLEARLPFLDNELLQLSQQTPWAIRSHGGRLKSPLRSLQQKIWKSSNLPDVPKLNPRKQGFSPPLRRLLDGPLRQWRDDLLQSNSLWFTQDTTMILDKLRRSGTDTHRLEWHICILKSWLSRFGIGS